MRNNFSILLQIYVNLIMYNLLLLFKWNQDDDGIVESLRPGAKKIHNIQISHSSHMIGSRTCTHA